jgi:CPA2 family monovalent cation:H+ antiporter-2
LFFVSVGMLFEPGIVLREPFKLLAVVAIIMLGKTAAAVVLVLALRYPLSTALTVGASLAQIGEFSFILAGLGLSLGLLPPEGQSLILAGALISITLNPLVFAAIDPVQRWVQTRSDLARKLARRDDPLAELPATVEVETLTGHVVLVGYGRVGTRIAEAMSDRGIPYVVAEVNRDSVERLRRRSIHAVLGDASEAEVLVQAHAARASLLVVATPDTVKVRKIVEIARTLNPRLHTLIRTHSDEEAELLRQENLGQVFMGEHELARAMARAVLSRFATETRSPPVQESPDRSLQS